MLLATTPSFPLHACHFYIPQSVFHLYKSLFLLREKHLEELQLVHHTKEFPNLLRKNQNQTDKKGMNIEIVLAESFSREIWQCIYCGLWNNLWDLWPELFNRPSVSFAFRAVWFMEYELELYVKSYLCVPLGVSMICICVFVCGFILTAAHCSLWFSAQRCSEVGERSDSHTLTLTAYTFLELNTSVIYL